MCINTGVSADSLSGNLEYVCISGERRLELEGNCLWGKPFCSWISKRRWNKWKEMKEMKQSVCCWSHVAAMAEIKLLNVQVLRAQTFLISQSQINSFIPCNSYTKDSLKRLKCTICLHDPCVVSAQPVYRLYFYGRMRIWQSCIGTIPYMTCSTLSHIIYEAEI